MKIAINLLPIEFRAQQIRSASFYKIQAFGVTIILVMIFLSVLVVALRFLQSQNILQIQNRVSAEEQKISDLKNTQGSLLLLKNRIITISQYLGTASKQAQMYQLITTLLPESFSVSSISVGKDGEILISGVVPDSSSLDNVISNLTSQSSNQDKISQISLDTISRGRDGVYRLSLKIKPK